MQVDKFFSVICGSSCPTSTTFSGTKAVDMFELQFRLQDDIIGMIPNQKQATDIRYLIRNTYNSLVYNSELSLAENLCRLNCDMEKEFAYSLSLILSEKNLSSDLRYVKGMLEYYLESEKFLEWVIKPNIRLVDSDLSKFGDPHMNLKERSHQISMMTKPESWIASGKNIAKFLDENPKCTVDDLINKCDGVKFSRELPKIIEDTQFMYIDKD